MAPAYRPTTREPRFVSAAETFGDFGPFTLPYLTLPYPTLGGCQPHCKWVYCLQRHSAAAEALAHFDGYCAGRGGRGGSGGGEVR